MCVCFATAAPPLLPPCRRNTHSKEERPWSGLAFLPDLQLRRAACTPLPAWRVGKPARWAFFSTIKRYPGPVQRAAFARISAGQTAEILESCQSKYPITTKDPRRQFTTGSRVPAEGNRNHTTGRTCYCGWPLLKGERRCALYRTEGGRGRGHCASAHAAKTRPAAMREWGATDPLGCHPIRCCVWAYRQTPAG